MNSISKLGVFALMLAASLTIMVGSAITPALLEISTHYGVTNQATWLTTLPALGVVLFAPFAGKLIHKIGNYKAICIGLLLYGAIGISAIWIDNHILVFADRILLGAATAITMAASTGLLADFFEGEKRLKMVALQGMSIEAGGIIFLSLGGILGSIGWQWPFLLYLISWIAFIFILLFVPSHKGLQMETTEDVVDSKQVEKVWPILVAALLAMTMFFVGFITLPFYLTDHFGLNAAGIGYLLASISFVAVLSASIMPKVVNRMTDYYTLGTGFILFASGFLILAFTQEFFLFVILAALFIGFGFGFTIPLANHMVVEKSSFTNRGKNLAYYSSAVFLGQFLSSFIEGLSDKLFVIYLLVAGVGCITSLTYFITTRRKRASKTDSIQV
ncbi:MFS transporter [Bacillus weihaiensis]|uniref:MFS transporter n=1 Tax=Bacillus weihaiensis TaxID=1547283 RepID=UPI00235360A8|nr:MFS transporter [Bacillus weihaiensis]